MSSDQPEGFADNWAYLKTELNWLERVLMVAVARHRKEIKEVDRVSQSRADKVTSHWWKGIVALEGDIFYDEHRKPNQANPIKNYQQQLEARIQVSLQRGVVLALPALRDRLGLTVFEKNLLLMSLAPEVNRRYAQLYRYLKGDDSPIKTDLPTVDLALRLLCRNDTEWRIARSRLVTSSPLIQHQLVQLLPCPADTFLNQPIKLAEPLLDYLLADQPSPPDVDRFILPPQSLPQAQHLTLQTSSTRWEEVILPKALLLDLKQLAERAQQRPLLEDRFQLDNHPSRPGQIALWVGPPGTGKTLSVKAIAHMLGYPLMSVDLNRVKPLDFPNLLAEIQVQAPTVLLVKSAQHWLRRSAAVSTAEINQFLAQRRRVTGITVLSVPLRPAVAIQWQKQMDQILEFPLPSRSDRLQLWQNTFPAQVPLADDIDWAILTKPKLTGAEIVAIVQSAMILWQIADTAKLTWEQVLAALAQHQSSKQG